MKTKVNINATKIFLIELQRSIVVKVKLNCYIKLQLIYTFFLLNLRVEWLNLNVFLNCYSLNGD